jgi:hypothetical protein
VPAFGAGVPAVTAAPPAAGGGRGCRAPPPPPPRARRRVWRAPGGAGRHAAARRGQPAALQGGQPAERRRGGRGQAPPAAQRAGGAARQRGGAARALCLRCAPRLRCCHPAASIGQPAARGGPAAPIRAPESRLPHPPPHRPQIRVFCRVKPHREPAVKCLPGATSLSLLCDHKENNFSFDRVFDPNATQQQVRAQAGGRGRHPPGQASPASSHCGARRAGPPAPGPAKLAAGVPHPRPPPTCPPPPCPASYPPRAQVFSAVSELVQSALDGYHVCLFSYGQTGAGKTHTMQGSDTPAGRGIIPRAVEKVRGRGAALPLPPSGCEPARCSPSSCAQHHLTAAPLPRPCPRSWSAPPSWRRRSGSTPWRRPS